MERIGRYEILGELGRGAMGVVYKARDPQINRIVAIKTILTAGLDPSQLSEYMSRFYREAQTAGRVSHPGIVTIHDIAEDEQKQPYLVMEFVEGFTLQSVLEGNEGTPERLSLERALNLGSQIAEALDHAHRHGVVHRDIKPANILVMSDDRTKIADFGIARMNDAEATRSPCMGTPAYMPPEQMRGERVDARGDIFSLGAMLYRMVTGQRPFPGEDIVSISYKVVNTDPVRPSSIRRDLPPSIDEVILRCLAKKPGDRYRTALDLANDLKAIREGKAIAAAPRQTDATVQLPLAAPQRSAAVKPSKVFGPNRLSARAGWLVAAGVLVVSLAVAGLYRPPAEPLPPKRSAQSASTQKTLVRDAPTVIEYLDRDKPASPPKPAETKSATVPLRVPSTRVARLPVAPALATARTVPSSSPPAAPPSQPGWDAVLALVESRAKTGNLASYNDVTRAPAVATPQREDRFAMPNTTPLPSAATPEPARENVAIREQPAIPTAQLLFEYKHNFRSAMMRITSGNREIVATKLEKRGILSSGQKAGTTVPLPVGVGIQRLRVHVKSNDDGDPFDQVAFIEGTFNDGDVRRLIIEFPDHILRLRWAGR